MRLPVCGMSIAEVSSRDVDSDGLAGMSHRAEDGRMASTNFDPVGYKRSTHDQWQAAAVAACDRQLAP
jgi:hypothetical protein